MSIRTKSGQNDWWGLSQELQNQSQLFAKKWRKKQAENKNKQKREGERKKIRLNRA